MTDEEKARLVAEQRARYERNYELLHGEEHKLENTTLFCDRDKCKHTECRYHRYNIRGSVGVTFASLFLSERCEAEKRRAVVESSIRERKKSYFQGL